MTQPAICIGANGEGRAHAVRALSLAGRLSERYRVHILASGQALEFLQQEQYPDLHPIVGPRFGRRANGSVSTVRTLINFVKMLWNLPRDVRETADLIKRLRPEAVITDFQPVVARAAHRLELPLISVDNQHKFRYCSAKDMPIMEKVYWFAAKLFLRWFIPKADLTVISNFHYKITPSEANQVCVTNVFLRDHFRSLKPSDDGFLLVYAKKTIGPEILKVIQNVNYPVRVYGVSEGPQAPHITYCGVGNQAFVEDLARCHGVIASAGNQLIGEAKYFGKPMLLVPEPGQQEQTINAILAKQEGVAEWTRLQNLRADHVRQLAAAQSSYLPEQTNGLDETAEAIFEFMEDE